MPPHRPRATPVPEQTESPFPSENGPSEIEIEAARQAEYANDPDRVDLGEWAPADIGTRTHVPPPLGTPGWFTDPVATGRPTSPPIWRGAQLHPGVVQLRVWKLETGRPVLVGVIDSRASEEDFIRTFAPVMPRAGEGNAEFKVRPIDRGGQEVMEEVLLPAISEHHTVLRQLRTVATQSGSAPALDLSPLHALLQGHQTLTERRFDAMSQEARDERERAQSLQDRLVTQQLDVASAHGRATEAVVERLMNHEQSRADRLAAMETQRNDAAIERERARSAEALAANRDVFAQVNTLTQTAIERERLLNDQRIREEQSRRDQERADAALRLQREQLEWQRRMDQERAENARKDERERTDREDRSRRLEAELQRAHEVRMKEIETAAQRDREHAERMMALGNRERKEESVEGLVTKATGLLAAFGMKPGDLLAKVFAPESTEPNPLIDLGVNALKEGFKVAGEYVKGNALAKIEAAKAAAAADARATAEAQRGHLLAPPMPEGFSEGVFPMSPEPVPVPAAPVAPPLPGADVPLAIAKPARKAIRELLGKLRTTPETEWETLVVTAIANETTIYHYVKAATVRGALMEAGADDAFVQRFLLHPACALIPPDVPRD